MATSGKKEKETKDEVLKMIQGGCFIGKRASEVQDYYNKNGHPSGPVKIESRSIQSGTKKTVSVTIGTESSDDEKTLIRWLASRFSNVTEIRNTEGDFLFVRTML